MSIPSRNPCADYSLFRKQYSKLPPVRQAKPEEVTVILQPRVYLKTGNMTNSEGFFT